MLISNKAKQTIDACRFCWMCRHICPIGNATGQERETARARAVALSLVERGAAKLEDVVDNVYECALCGACTKECATGWDPILFTKEVRREIAMEGLLPKYIETMLDNLDATGNAYGVKSINAKLKKAIASTSEKTDTLLFLGQDARTKASTYAIEAIELLQKAGVKFTVLENEPNSGWVYDTLIGATDETKEVMKKATETLNAYKTVIALDPVDAKTFLREYKEWGLGLKAKVETFTSVAAGLLKKLKPKKSEHKLSFQDPAQLARDLEETEPAREILNACGENCEMLLHGKDTMFGGNLLMNEYMPDTMAKVAADRWVNFEATGAQTLVCASPSEYEVLKMHKPAGKKIVTVAGLLLDACK